MNKLLHFPDFDFFTRTKYRTQMNILLQFPVFDFFPRTKDHKQMNKLLHFTVFYFFSRTKNHKQMNELLHFTVHVQFSRSVSITSIAYKNGLIIVDQICEFYKLAQTQICESTQRIALLHLDR